MSKFSYVISVLFAFGLLGCSSQQIETAIPNFPTLTNTLEIVTPQSTPGPTLTHVPTRAPTQTPNVFTYPFENPNFATPNPLTRQLESSYTFPSPNGIWMADAGIDLRINHISGNVVWEIPIQVDGLELWESPCCGRFSAIQWSPDNQYLFFSRYPTIDGGVQLGNATGLWRLDILSGEILEILPVDGDSRTHEIKSLMISPDGEILAYIPEVKNPDPDIRPTRSIIFRDLESGLQTEYLLDKKYLLAGEVFWASDNVHVLFVAGDFQEDGDFKNARFDYVLINSDNGSTTTLFELVGYPLNLAAINWSRSNLIEFHYKGCATWYFDVDLKDFVAQATPTPFPWVGESVECRD